MEFQFTLVYFAYWSILVRAGDCGRVYAAPDPWGDEYGLKSPTFPLLIPTLSRGGGGWGGGGSGLHWIMHK